ncbi:MAG: MlaD family protein [Alistipes sp.]
MKRELKIGIFAVIMIGCAWAGIRFLSGFDIFSRNVDYYAAYDQINGVQTASPVMIRGVKVGTVTGISFNPTKNQNVVLKLTVKKQYHIPVNSEAKIFSSSLMGAKAIEIYFGDSPKMLEKGDTLAASRDRDMMDVAASELDFFKQKVAQLTTDLSKTLGNINMLIDDNANNIKGMTTHMNSISKNVDGMLIAERANLQNGISNLSKFSSALGRNASRVDSIMGNVDRFSSDLANSGLTDKLDHSLTELNTLLARINAGEGTVGKLMNDERLYTSLQQASVNLTTLLADLQAHPKRYVHFSLFGRSEKKDLKDQQKEAAKRMKDSIRNSQQLSADEHK